MRKLLNLLVLFVILGSLGFWYLRHNARHLLAPADALGSLELVDLSGEPVDPSVFSDRPLVLNYWATWCAPCLAEFPTFEYALSGLDDRVHFVMVSDEPLATIARFKERNDYGFTFLHTRTPLTFFGTSARPLTYFYRQGLQRSARYAGAINGVELERELDRLLD